MLKIIVISFGLLASGMVRADTALYERYVDNEINISEKFKDRLKCVSPDSKYYSELWIMLDGSPYPWYMDKAVAARRSVYRACQDQLVVQGKLDRDEDNL